MSISQKKNIKLNPKKEENNNDNSNKNHSRF